MKRKPIKDVPKDVDVLLIKADGSVSLGSKDAKNEGFWEYYDSWFIPEKDCELEKKLRLQGNLGSLHLCFLLN